uniref:Uncharacterized protein n=1 Tax=Anguilla anguilla TaxID=7936 RepID=A0A0E9U323_ANGAN
MFSMGMLQRAASPANTVLHTLNGTALDTFHPKDQGRDKNT